MTDSILDTTPEDFTLEGLFASGFFGNTSMIEFVDDEMGVPPELITSPKSRRSNGRSITQDDWEEEEESEAFSRLRKIVRQACNKNIKDSVRRKAMDWIFIPGKEDGDGITFDLCCTALESRGDLIRVRLQYQLYDSKIITEPLPFMAYGIPQTMRSEIDYLCKPGSLNVAHILWANPGIRLDFIGARLGLHLTDLEPIINSLERTGYAGFWLGHGWFMGKNPVVMPQKERMRFKWAELVL